MKLSGEHGAMVMEALKTGSGRKAGPRGALRQSPEGLSEGKQRSAWPHSLCSPIKRYTSQF